MAAAYPLSPRKRVAASSTAAIPNNMMMLDELTVNIKSSYPIDIPFHSGTKLPKNQQTELFIYIFLNTRLETLEYLSDVPPHLRGNR